MPREQINFPDSRIVADGTSGLPDAVRTVVDPVIHVNWHSAGADGLEPGGHVQVALECDRSYFEQFPDEQRGCRYSPVLTRGELNKLIRVLRRARDAAYGRDE